jgi:hypothetical protein
VLHHLLELPVEQVVAEADGNRTRLSRVAAHTGFEATCERSQLGLPSPLRLV